MTATRLIVVGLCEESNIAFDNDRDQVDNPEDGQTDYEQFPETGDDVTSR